MTTPTLGRALLGEFVGTFILIFFGCGAVHSAVLTKTLTGLWQVGIVWGLGVMIAAYCVGAASGAHLNPAVSIALAAFGRFTWGRVGPYIVAQIAGAFVAAAVLFGVYHGIITMVSGPGRPLDVHTAMCYGEYYPNPDLIRPFVPEAGALMVSTTAAFFAEVVGTAILAFVVFATTDESNRGRPAERFAPVFVGLTVTALICVIAPLTQACFNPARDFGPRLWAYFAGWGNVAIPGPNGHGFFTVYIVAPIVGAVIGAGVYQLLIRESVQATSFEKGT